MEIHDSFFFHFSVEILGKIGSLLIIKKIGIKILKDDACWNLGNWKNLVANDFNNILCASYPWTYRVGTDWYHIDFMYALSRFKRDNLFSSFSLVQKVLFYLLFP